MKKVLGVIKKIIIGICAIVFFSFVIAMTVLLLNFNDFGVTQFDNKSLVIINDDISSDIYKKGDLVIVEFKKIDKINVGDEVFVYKVNNDKKVNIDIGKVGKIYLQDQAITFENGDTYAIEFVIGQASKVYSKIGTYLSIIESTWGFLFIIIIPSFLIFIYEFYALIVEIKYGKDEVVASN